MSAERRTANPRYIISFVGLSRTQSNIRQSVTPRLARYLSEPASYIVPYDCRRLGSARDTGSVNSFHPSLQQNSLVGEVKRGKDSLLAHLVNFWAWLDGCSWDESNYLSRSLRVLWIDLNDLAHQDQLLPQAPVKPRYEGQKSQRSRVSKRCKQPFHPF